MIDTFYRPKSCKEKHIRIIIIIFFYGVPTTRVIREISILANCRLIVNLPSATVAFVHGASTGPPLEQSGPL